MISVPEAPPASNRRRSEKEQINNNLLALGEKAEIPHGTNIYYTKIITTLEILSKQLGRGEEAHSIRNIVKATK